MWHENEVFDKNKKHYIVNWHFAGRGGGHRRHFWVHGAVLRQGVSQVHQVVVQPLFQLQHLNLLDARAVKLIANLHTWETNEGLFRLWLCHVFRPLALPNKKSHKPLTLFINNIPQDKCGSQAFPSSLDTNAGKSIGFPVGMRVGHGHCQNTPWKQLTSPVHS